MRSKIICIIFIGIIFLVLATSELIQRTIGKSLDSIYFHCDRQIDKSKFLQYVIENISYYKNLKLSSEKSEPNLKDFPIVNKKIISNSNELFINKSIELMEQSKISAGNSWTKKKENSINSINYLNFINYAWGLFNDKAIAHISGGSTGLYFYQWYTLKEYFFGLYGFMRCWKNLGWTPNKKILLIYFHGANSVKLLNKLNIFTREYFYSYSPELNSSGDITEKSVIEIVDIINKFEPYLIVSFPSIIYRLSENIWSKNLKLTHYPKSMDLSADFLFTCQYNFIKKIFTDCNILLSYGTIEFGQIAQQIPGSMYDYIVFDNISDVENFNDNLVITNYLFTTQPIIKYLTDDFGIVYKYQTQTIIKNLIGKNNWFYSNSFDYIKIDEHINKFKYSDIIINLRIDMNQMIIYIIVINEDFNKQVKNYFEEKFNSWDKKFTIIINSCSKNQKQCKTIDTYNRKNTPIIGDFSIGIGISK